jgi:hypothetical protein
LATPRFWQLYKQLPEAAQRLADKNYKFWLKDPRHPSLHFKKLKGSASLYSIRIGDKFRALGNVRADEVEWVWIGTHEEYNKLIGRAK